MTRNILKLIKKRENLKKDFLQLTLETFEKRYKLSDYDGSITDQITCLLRPPINSTQLPQTPNQHNTTSNFTNNTHLLNQMENNVKNRQSLSQNNNHYNSSNKTQVEKNLSSIDKTIVSLINSNKLKTLGSPPHSSLKKLGGSLAENDFLVDSIYNGVDKTKLGNANDNKVRRNKKEKRVRNEDSSSSTTSTISSLISHGLNKHGQLDQLTSKRLIGDLIDLSNKSKQMQGQMKSHGKPLAGGQNSGQGIHKASVSPLGNRLILAQQQQQQVNKLELLRRSYKNLNLADLEQLQLNRLANAQRRRRNTTATTATTATAGSEATTKLPSVDNNKKLNTSEATAALLLGNGTNRSADLAAADLLASPPGGGGPASCQKSDDLMQIFNELRDYEEELRVNQIENLDSMLSETKSRVSTSSDKDGYWYFKRKEGCKYLPVS